MTTDTPDDGERILEYDCTECDYEAQIAASTDPWDCPFCGAELEEVTPDDAVPAEELRELIAEWREKANDLDSDLHGNAQFTAYHEAANELSALLADVGGERDE